MAKLKRVEMVGELRGQRSGLNKPRAAVEGGRGQLFVSVSPAPLVDARILSSGVPHSGRGKTSTKSEMKVRSEEQVFTNEDSLRLQSETDASLLAACLLRRPSHNSD